jgi:hypothetical protein
MSFDQGFGCIDDLFADAWCRDDRCARLGLHVAHEAQGEDFSDEVKEEAKRASKSKKPVWKRPAPKALDHCIAKAVSQTYPKRLDTIFREVEEDYGLDSTRSALYRNVQRHLYKLVERGHILQVDLGRRLYAYLRPGSALLADLNLMREQLREQIENTSDTHSVRA